MTLQKKYRDYQVVAKDFEDDLRAKEQDIFKKLFPEVLKIVRSIAEKEKYTMVLDPYVLQLPYFNAKEDITSASWKSSTGPSRTRRNKGTGVDRNTA
jgi:outer membrane protein